MPSSANLLPSALPPVVAHSGAAVGPRAVPGSQRPVERGSGDAAVSGLGVGSAVLRAGDGSRSVTDASPHWLTAGSRSGRVFLIFTALLAAAGGLVLFCFDPRQYHFYPVCFLHQTTGLLCPGCGALRAMHQLLHGHLAVAFKFNPMVVASLPALAWLGARSGLRMTKNRSVGLGLRPIWLWLLLAAVLVFSVLRNVPGTAFALLRP